MENFVEFITQTDTFFKALFPVLYVIFLRLSYPFSFFPNAFSFFSTATRSGWILGFFALWFRTRNFLPAPDLVLYKP